MFSDAVILFFFSFWVLQGVEGNCPESVEGNDAEGVEARAAEGLEAKEMRRRRRNQRTMERKKRMRKLVFGFLTDLARNVESEVCFDIVSGCSLFHVFICFV